MARSDHGDSWRWELSRHQRPITYTGPTIAVAEASAEQAKARERKIKDGARVVPFGFARALGGDPARWEGDDS